MVRVFLVCVEVSEVSLTCVVWACDVFGINSRIMCNFIKYLKETCELGSDEQFFLKCLRKNNDNYKDNIIRFLLDFTIIVRLLFATGTVCPFFREKGLTHFMS